MHQSRRFSGLHYVLRHLAGMGTPATTKARPRATSSHPVVVLQRMAILCGAGLVVSVEGHGDGWLLLVEATGALDLRRPLGRHLEPGAAALNLRH
jgi:DNA-binding IscR family transcriptional regulator